MAFEINPHFGTPQRVRFWIDDQWFELDGERTGDTEANASEHRELVAMMLRQALIRLSNPKNHLEQAAITINGSATIREIEDALAERGFFARYWLSPNRAQAELARARSKSGKRDTRGIPDGWQLVRTIPTEEQRQGLARALMQAFDMQEDTPTKLVAYLRESGVEPPQWLLDEPNMTHLDRPLSTGARCLLIYRTMLADAPVATASIVQDPLTPLAFDLADESMMALLHGLGQPIADRRIALRGIDGDNVQRMSEADPAIKEAFVWLSRRGRACLEQNESGHSVVLVDTTTEEAH